MRRGWSVLVSLGILAAGGFLAWRLVFPPDGGRPGRPESEPAAAASRESASRADGAPVVAPVPVAGGPAPSARDQITGTVYDDGGRAVSGAVVQIIRFV